MSPRHWPCLLALVCSAAGCAVHEAQHYAGLRPSLAAHREDLGLSYLARTEHTFYKDHGRLLYLMDRAMVAFDGGDDGACVKTLEAAKLLAEKLFTVSIKSELGAWFGNDTSRPYEGEDFEKVFLHTLGALSYARRGALDDARVEARQVASLLDLLGRRLEGSANRYKDDAFAHFLAGLLFEADANALGRLSDARIEYARALALYEQQDGPFPRTPPPKQLVVRLGRVLSALGDDGAPARRALRSRYGGLVQDAKPEPGHGDTASAPARVVVVLLLGEAPLKGEAFWDVAVGPNLYRVAYPMFLRSPEVRLPAIAINGRRPQAPLELVMDVEAVAVTNLMDHMDHLKNRVLAREVAKYVAGTAAEVVGLERGGLAGFGAFLAGVALNTATAANAHADTRSWATLPRGVFLLDEAVPPGPTTVVVGDQAPRTLQLVAGQTAFVALRALR